MSSLCTSPINFPLAIENRPGLSRIQYRIGQYSDFRTAMLNALDQSLVLRQWTHRGADDPGIALVEGAAILGDILTFYQELYANEVWLRTAAWPESIASLVRLIGYRPAPGMGGVGHIAFSISGNATVTIPAGFPLSAQIAGASEPANFETAESLVALPALSSFHLFVPTTLPAVYTGAVRLGANAAEISSAGVTLKPNDRLMLVDNANSANRQISVVKTVDTILDQTVVTLAGTWQDSDAAGMTAYKLGRTFRAFGYNAPSTEFSVDSSGTLVSNPVVTTVDFETMLESFPLDRQVNDLSAGVTMLLELEVKSIFGSTQTNYFASQVALSVKSDTDSVGPMQGGITRVAFRHPLPTGTFIVFQFVDRRTAVCHEVVGEGFSVMGVRTIDFSAAKNELDFLGTGTAYEALDGRLLQFVILNPDGSADRVEESTATIRRGEIGDLQTQALRRLSLAPQLTQFQWKDFRQTGSDITVLGNVVAMTEGKTQSIAVLGNGDARQVFQSFQLPKAPLTWLLDESLSPPRKPQVRILVNAIEWTQVASLFASGPKDQVYILREATDGTTWVAFGDGINGSRLASGVNNITAAYRTETGANGWLQSGAKPQANGRIANLDKLYLYNEVTGGTDDEDASHIKQAAPGRVEELNRLVSLSDFEYEALSLPGVEKASARWDTEDNIPLLKLMVLLSDNSAAQLSGVQGSMSAANANRGTDRFSVLVAGASLEYVYLAIKIGLVTGYQTDVVLAGVRQALGVLPSDGSDAPQDGLFSIARRNLGEDEYSSRIEGTVQNVDGVKWVEVVALASLGIADAPSDLNVPPVPILQPAIACASNRVLALYASHFNASIGDA